MFARNEGKASAKPESHRRLFSLGGNLAVLGAKTRVKNESNCARRLLGSVGGDVLVLRIRLFWHAVFVRQREKETGKERERREGGMTRTGQSGIFILHWL